MLIRAAGPDDVPAVLALWARAGGPTHLPPDEPMARTLVAHDPDALLLALDGDELAGSLIVGWDGWRIRLYRMAVDERWRRRGVASQLWAAGIERSRALGAARVEAMVADANEGAVAFWSAVGFTLDEDDSRWTLNL